jgi:bifunctional non-homologous end joining protein LigD
MPLPRGFVPPCLPTKAPQPPTGDAWLHEIKHDGFRVVARKDGERVKLYSRPGNDLTCRFALNAPHLVPIEAWSVPPRSCAVALPRR